MTEGVRIERGQDRRREPIGPLLMDERRVTLDRRRTVQDEVLPVTPCLTLKWGLFCGHLSRPDMPMLIARDKAFLEYYVETHLHFAYVSWEIREISVREVGVWFK